jgi:ABC-type antimicrobial peptide transport system permease subunit
MLGILKNNIPKDILKNKATYLLMAAFVAIGMYIASTLASVTYSTEVVCEENYITSNYQDGQFSLRNPLADQQELSIEKMGYTLERIFSFDKEMEDGSILRFFKVRKRIDLLILDDGRLPENSGELVMDKCYAFSHGLKTGDEVIIGARSYLITGVGSVTDYDMPARGIADYSSNSEIFGIAFLTDEDYESLLSESGSTTREEYIYSYKLADDHTDDDLREEILTFFEDSDDVLTFVPRNNNGRMCRAVMDGYTYEVGGLVIGIGLLILVSVVFYLSIRASIEKESASIGALYAMGVKKYEVILMYLAPSTLVAFVAGLVGWILSMQISIAEVISPSYYYCIPPVPVISSPYIIAYCVLMPPAICFVVNLISLNKCLSLPPVSLLKGTFNTDDIRHKKAGKNHGIMFDLVCSRFIQDIGLFFVLLIGSLVAGLIYMLGVGISQYIGNIEVSFPYEIKYEYVYDLLEDTEVPSKTGESVYKKVLKIRNMDYVADVPFIGIDTPSKYFDVNTDDLNGKVVISSALTSRYDLKENSRFDVYDDVTGKEYTFTVASIVDYKVMYSVYMNIDDMRKLLGKGEVYNSVYADEPCDYEADKLLGSYVRDDFIKPLESLKPEAERMSIFLIIIAIFFYAAMLIFIVRFSVNVAMRHIAIHSVLGYSYGELKLIFLSSTAVFSAVCGAVGLIAGFWFSKLVAPYLIGTTRVGVFLYYTPMEFARDFLVVILIYCLSTIVSLGQIRNVHELDYVRANE